MKSLLTFTIIILIQTASMSQAPIADVSISGKLTPKAGTSETYTVKEGLGTKYSWYVSNGTFLNGNIISVGKNTKTIKWDKCIDGKFKKGLIIVTVLDNIGGHVVAVASAHSAITLTCNSSSTE